MKPKERFQRSPAACTGSIQSFPAPFSMLSIVVLLIASGSSYAQDVVAQPPLSISLKGHLCCPADHFLGSDGCSPLPNNTTFSPTITNKNNASDDVIWEYHTLECPPGYEAKQYTLDEASNKLLKDKDGLYLQWRELVLKTTKNFCVNLLPSGTYVGVTCRPNTTELCTEVTTCVQKCCNDGEVLSLGNGACTPSPNSTFSFEFQSISGIKRPEPGNLLILHQIPDCEKTTLLLNPAANPDHHFYLHQDGFLYQPTEQKTFKENRFCLDNFIFPGAKGTQLAAFICSGPGLPTEATLKTRFYAAGVMISAIFLMVMILFHIFVPKLRDMPGLCLLSHMISLMVAEVALFFGYILHNDIHHEHCVINGFLLQFSLLAAFFWLNVMCFDIWRIIRGTVSVIPLSSIQANDEKKFKIYSAYAWSGPLVFTLVAIILHYLPENSDQSFLRPGFGVISCWFSGDLERLAFFYGVISILFLGNILLLGHTIVMLHQAGAAFLCCRKSVGISNCNRGHLEAFWQRFCLFTLMALCWVTEILSWKIPPENLWILTDIINTLQGFFVFVIFISSRKKRDILKEALFKTFSRMSDAARKLSQSDDTGVIWHASKSTSSTYGSQENPSQEVVAAVEQNDQPVNPSPIKEDP